MATNVRDSKDNMELLQHAMDDLNYISNMRSTSLDQDQKVALETAQEALKTVYLLERAKGSVQKYE